MQGRVVLRIGGSGKKAGFFATLAAYSAQFRPSHYNLLRESLSFKYSYSNDHLGDFNVSLLDQLLKNKSLRMIGYCDKLNAGYAADWYARQAE